MLGRVIAIAVLGLWMVVAPFILHAASTLTDSSVVAGVLTALLACSIMAGNDRIRRLLHGRRA